MNNREDFEMYFNIINREGKDKLSEYLENNGYFTSPSSSQYHGAKVAGNIEHSLNVVRTMFDIKLGLYGSTAFGNQLLPDESIIIAGLFHDLGKCTYFNEPTYVPNILKSGKASEDKPYKHNPDGLPIPHEIASLHILSKFIQLTPDETIAILYHNGLYVPLGREISGKETPLMLLLHMADMWSSRIIEGDYKVFDGRLF